MNTSERSNPRPSAWRRVHPALRLLYGIGAVAMPVSLIMRDERLLYASALFEAPALVVGFREAVREKGARYVAGIGALTVVVVVPATAVGLLVVTLFRLPWSAFVLTAFLFLYLLSVVPVFRRVRRWLGRREAGRTA